MAAKRKSYLELAAIEVLSRSETPLSLVTLAEKIRELDPSLLKGRKPKNSLYSVIYRRERMRAKEGRANIFKRIDKDKMSFYTLVGKSE